MAKKPVIQVTERSPFGSESVDESVLQDPGFDTFNLPGYSDKRRNYDLATRDGDRPVTLKHRFQAVRTKTLDGRPDRRKASEYESRGYRAVKSTDLKDLGIDLAKSAWHVAADGTVEQAEYTLFVADSSVVRRDIAKKELAEKQQQDAQYESMEAAVENYNLSLGLKGPGAARAVREND